MHVVRLTYYSENWLDPIAGSMLHALQEILAASKRNNIKREVTGMLAFDSQWFIQTLEGDRDVVWDAFLTIMRDVRHGGVKLVESTPIRTRMFGEWSMRLVMRNADNQVLFDPFMADGVLQPHLMSGTDMLQLLDGVAHHTKARSAVDLPLAG